MKWILSILALVAVVQQSAYSSQNSVYVVMLNNAAPTELPYQYGYKASSNQRYHHVRNVLTYRYQHQLVPFVQGLTAQKSFQGVQNRYIEYLPLVHGVAMQLTAQEVQALQGHPQVSKILADDRIYLDEPVQQPVQDFASYYWAKDNGGLGVGLKLHKVDTLIENGVNIHTPGKVVGVIDTGVDGRHPDLEGKVVRFRNFRDGSTTPVDGGSHGTHVSGIIAGGNKSGVQIGVYPGAKLVVAGALSSISNMLSAMQWMLDPDGDPQTADQPFVINNSWHIGSSDPEPFYKAIEALKDADILVCFSAGNAGRRGLTHPKEHPLTFTTAAVNGRGDIASFSSWGPAVYKGQTLQKPEVASYGEKVLSTLPNGRYGEMSGTSMASPFTAGAVALLGSLFPGVSPYVIAETLRRTAVSRTQGEWDQQYGYGVLDVSGAYSMLAQMAQQNY